MPAARGHFRGIGAQAFGVQPLNRPLHQRREILAPPRQRHRLDEETDGIRSHHAVDQRAGVIRRRQLPSRMLLGGAGDIEHVTARRLDEQRLLGAKIVGNLARKGVGRGRNIGDRNRRQPALLEQPARRIEQPRAHLPARGAGCPHGVLGIAQMLSGGSALHASSCAQAARIFDRFLNLYVIQTNLSSRRGGHERRTQAAGLQVDPIARNGALGKL